MTNRPPQVEDRHPYGSPEHTAAHYNRHPNRRGMSGDQRRQNAQQETSRASDAKRQGLTCPTPSCTWPTTDHRHDPGQPVLPPIWRNP